MYGTPSYLADYPTPTYTPAEYASPANPVSYGPTMYDPTLYYATAPGGRFPGDQWFYDEFLRYYGGNWPNVDRQDEGGDGSGQQSWWKRMLSSILLGSGGDPTRLATIWNLIKNHGDFTAPTNPQTGGPEFLYSGAAGAGPSGGAFSGLLDRGRQTQGEFGPYGFSDPGGGVSGSGGGGGSPEWTGGGLPAWQGQQANLGVLDWQPDNPAGAPTRMVNAFDQSQAWSPEGWNAPPPEPWTGEVTGGGSPGESASLEQRLMQMLGLSGSEPLGDQLGAFLQTLASQADSGSIEAQSLLNGMGFGPSRGGRWRDLVSDTSNLSPADLNFGPDWSGVTSSTRDGLGYSGTDSGGDVYGGFGGVGFGGLPFWADRTYGPGGGGRLFGDLPTLFY